MNEKQKLIELMNRRVLIKILLISQRRSGILHSFTAPKRHTMFYTKKKSDIDICRYIILSIIMIVHNKLQEPVLIYCMYIHV